MPWVFPLEIEETILDILAEDDKGLSAVKACSLVCQAFLPICRKYIFGYIVLNDYDRVSCPTNHAFERLLHETPEIADYIIKLDYSIRIADLSSTSIQKSLKLISRLKCLTIRDRDMRRLDWYDNPIRPALLHLIHLPTLTHLKVTHINNFVVSDLLPCVNLKYFDIGLYTTVAAENTFPAALPEHSIQLNEFVAGFRTSSAVVKICRARRPDGKPIIDIGSLSKVVLDLRELDEGEAPHVELFTRCHVLTDVDIPFRDPRNRRPGLADMLRPSMHTLKHIVVNMEVDGVEDDPLRGIPSELEKMSNTNIIETVTIGIVILPGARRLGGDDWRRLDEMLTTSGWLSLKRVSLVIERATYGRTDDDELDVALRKLPETQFRRLSSSNSVSFDFEVIPVSFL